MKLTKVVSLLDVIDHGLDEANRHSVQGFEYVIGKVKGGTLTVCFTPDNESSYESVVLDDEALRYTLVTE